MGTSSPAGNSDWTVPILKFGTRNNWLKLKEKITTACIEKYGDLARLVQFKAFYTLPEIEGERMEPFVGWQSDKVKEITSLRSKRVRKPSGR